MAFGPNTREVNFRVFIDNKHSITYDNYVKEQDTQNPQGVSDSGLNLSDVFLAMEDDDHLPQWIRILEKELQKMKEEFPKTEPPPKKTKAISP